MKKLKTISWVDEKGTLPGDFGPPAFDETGRAYMWRIFKRGFTWGKRQVLIACRVHADDLSDGAVPIRDISDARDGREDPFHLRDTAPRLGDLVRDRFRAL